MAKILHGVGYPARVAGARGITTRCPRDHESTSVGSRPAFCECARQRASEVACWVAQKRVEKFAGHVRILVFRKC